MKPILRFSGCILLMATVIFTSCKKDKIVSSVVAPPLNNHMPAAKAGTDQTITLPNNTITLDGSSSADPDNNISGYDWTKISGPASFSIVNAQAVQTQVNNLVQGVYLFELKVTDSTNFFARDTVQIIVNTAPLPPSNTKTIKARVIEYGTNLPIAGATLSVCTSPTGYNTCAGNYLKLTTDANGNCIFHADLFNYGWVEKEDYYGYIFDPCLVTYFRNDTLLDYNDDYTADSFIVEIVPKINFSIHVKDSSGREAGDNFLIADVDFHNFCCSLPGVISANLRSGIDTTFQLHDYYGNASYLFLVGYGPDSEGYPQTILYNKTKYIAKGNNTVVNIIY